MVPRGRQMTFVTTSLLLTLLQRTLFKAQKLSSFNPLPPLHYVRRKVIMYCQKCRTPLRLDSSLEDLNPAAYDLLVGASISIVS